VALPSKAVLSILCISDAVFPGLKQNLLQIYYSFTPVIRKLQIKLNTHNNQRPARKNAEGYGYNIQQTK
jgi:hypothetical protein